MADEVNEAMRLSGHAATYAKDDEAAWLLVVYFQILALDREELIIQAHEMAP
jgi:hypothetical protein